jgi:hypothetical protein
LGRVAHKLLEQAAGGALVGFGEQQVERRWLELVSSEEGLLAENWIERHLVPLKESVTDYEVRRIQACNRALSISLEVAEYSGGVRGSRTPGRGFELYVSSEDGRMHGKIDAVISSEGGPIVRDYKTGGIFERSGTQGTVRPEYILQLQLYAAMYEATFKQWPYKLEIVPLNGTAESVEYDRDECRDVLARAINDLTALNAEIEKHEHHAEELQYRLAHPSIEACRYCPFRPACLPYRELCPTFDRNGWVDVIGQFDQITTLGNATLSVNVKVGTDVVRIRNLNASKERHPALSRVKSGDSIGFFAVSKRSASTCVETQNTLVYKL